MASDVPELWIQSGVCKRCTLSRVPATVGACTDLFLWQIGHAVFFLADEGLMPGCMQPSRLSTVQRGLEMRFREFIIHLNFFLIKLSC